MLESGSVAISTSARVGAARAPVAEHERERARAPQGRNRTQHPALPWRHVCCGLARRHAPALGQPDNSVKLWEAATGRLLRTFEGHSQAVTSVAFSPDGAYLLSGSADKTFKLWDAATGQLVRSPDGAPCSGQVGCILARRHPPAIAGSELARQHTQGLGCRERAAASAPYEGHSGPVTLGGVLARRHEPALGQRDKTVKLWDAASGQLIRTFRGMLIRSTSVAFSPDGSRLLSGSRTMEG